MKNNLQLNADRFLGFADIYDRARPKCPEQVKEILLRYLGHKPALVIDMGCGTGLSTIIWSKESSKVIGIEPSDDMRKVAQEKSAGLHNVDFIAAFSDNTGLGNNCADIITCSQSFHWMNPETTLNEVSRVLKEGGIFATYDYDWPPVCDWQGEMEYQRLFDKIKTIEYTYPQIKNSFIRWEKNRHLEHIKNSEKFRYVREIVFLNTEDCNAHKFISLALSHGGLQTIIKANIHEIDSDVARFKERILDIFGNNNFKVSFGYRMRIGIK